MTTIWTSQDIAKYRPGQVGHPRRIDRDDVHKMLRGLDVWDIGPVRTAQGSPAAVWGRTLWIGLSASDDGDPSQRHDRAALRLFSPDGDGSWQDLGPLFPPGQAAGNRQWAGSAIVERGRMWVTYTAVGSSNDLERSFRQRLFESSAEIVGDATEPRLRNWTSHTELFAPDLDRYDPADEAKGGPGFIKAFRDPFPFLDPQSGQQYLLYTASLAAKRSTTEFNGAVGIARWRTDIAVWEQLDPLVTADRVNNELERPHIIAYNARFYLFFSTQARTFHPDVEGPTGLFGFVAQTLLGPYRPLNGHGVVFTNPPDEPLQAYSWLVLDDLSTISFIDAHSLRGRSHRGDDDDVSTDRDHFGGSIAPTVRIGLDEARAWIIDEPAVHATVDRP